MVKCLCFLKLSISEIGKIGQIRHMNESKKINLYHDFERHPQLLYDLYNIVLTAGSEQSLCQIHEAEIRGTHGSGYT